MKKLHKGRRKDGGDNNGEITRLSFKGMEGEFERIASRSAMSTISLTNGILPPLGNQSNRRIKLRPFIVSPFDTRYRFQFLLQFAAIFVEIRKGTDLGFVIKGITPTLEDGIKQKLHMFLRYETFVQKKLIRA